MYAKQEVNLFGAILNIFIKHYLHKSSLSTAKAERNPQNICFQ